ncbi:Histone acetyltransferase type B catalytic subunit [Escovopsis weberi]|uniref:Histone acetyltransferase type B catalytic subunit n=1 Tax=Escovopsis weberi TaxID=150374 RepID=A0A0M9VSL9_ESCWE|nr:Histone acetyltransferase type B catalytic subunit [Escovopsis weberi]
MPQSKELDTPRRRDALDRPQDRDAWFSDSNEALFLTMRAAAKGGPRDLATFHPRFTYSIFGEEERIFGHRDLRVQLRFRANDMRPHLQVSSSSTFPDDPSEVTNVEEVLQAGNYLPQVAYVKRKEFEEAIQATGDDWRPPGTLHCGFQMADGDYEIWQGKLSCPIIKTMVDNTQFLVPLFIEGGSYIGSDPEGESDELDLSDADRWTVWFLYKTEKSSFAPDKKAYTFVGFASVYRFFYFRAPKPAAPADKGWEIPKGEMDMGQLPCRSRLSQFLILPPFQGKGKGAVFYRTIFEHYQRQPQTHEFTVENPNEAFDDLRDYCDLAFLRKMPEFQALRLDPDVVVPKRGLVPPLIAGQQKLDEIRLKAKIAPRQFARVLEMHLMSQLPDSVRPTMSLDDDDRPDPSDEDKKLERSWQLVAKQRLYRHNKDVLAQISLRERKEKLHETLGGVELEYARLLAAADRMAAHELEMSAGPSGNGKRKLDDASNGDSTSGKKTRVEAL